MKPSMILHLCLSSELTKIKLKAKENCKVDFLCVSIHHFALTKAGRRSISFVSTHLIPIFFVSLSH